MDDGFTVTDCLNAPNQVRDRVRRMGERLLEFLLSRRVGVGQGCAQPTRCFAPGSPGRGTPLVAFGPAFGQLIITSVNVWKDVTDGLLGSLHVVGEARSFFLVVGLNTRVYSECITAEPWPPCTR